MSKELLQFSLRLIEHVESEAAKHNMTVKLDEAPFTKSSGDSVGSSGYFDDSKRILATATYKPIQEWITTFAHEYCHMTQFIHGAKAWTDLYHGMPKDTDATSVCFNWVAGDTAYSARTVNAAINITMMLEFDCEKKAVGLMQFMGAPIDLEVYTQKALAYILFYHAVKKYRTWYDPFNPPYSNEAIWSKMPKTFDFDFTDGARMLALADFTICFPKDFPNV